MKILSCCARAAARTGGSLATALAAAGSIVGVATVASVAAMAGMAGANAGSGGQETGWGA